MIDVGNVFFFPFYSEVKRTCTGIKQANSSAESGSYIIDPDGAGGLAPFSVYCHMTGAGETKFFHDLMRHHRYTVYYSVNVDGYEDPGSFARSINYEHSLSQIGAVIAVSASCKQYLLYQCSKSMLFLNGPWA